MGALKKREGTARLVAEGLLASLFFSATFVLNRAMSLSGGHWVWSASLRYADMLVLLVAWLLLTGQGRVLWRTLQEYRAHWAFWTSAGSVGFGLFYGLIAFSGAHAKGWVVATSWQFTLLASLVVLRVFGRRVPLRGLAFTALILVGIALVTAEQGRHLSRWEVGLGLLPVLGAAFAYPLGNQMVWEVGHGRFRRMAVEASVLDHPMARVLLLVLGSLPFWAVLVAVVHPNPPSKGQLLKSALVALLSGVIATRLFLAARDSARSPYELAAVDATQAGEVVFSVLGEVTLLSGAVPGILGMAGVALVVGGLLLYVLAQARPA